MAVTLETTLKTNDFGNFHIAPVDTSYQLSGANVYKEEASELMTVIDLTGVYASLPNYDPSSDMSYIQQGHTDEEVRSDEYQEYLDRFANNVYFLCGDIHSGGLFFYKRLDGQNYVLQLGCVYCYGQYHDGNTELNRYVIYGTVNDGLLPSECKEVCIGFMDSVNESFPSFCLYAKNATLTIDVWGWTAAIPPAPVAYFNIVRNTTSLIDAVSNKEWVGGFLDQIFDTLEPAQGWSQLKRQMITMSDPGLDSWSGDWSGGYEIDPSEDPYNKGGGSEGGGGNGDYPTNSDPVDVPDPNEAGVDATGTGFITLYNPTEAQAKAFNDYLFSGSITDNISAQLKKLIADPIDYLVFIAMVRFKPTSSIALKHISFAGIDTGVSAPVINPQFKQIDCGTVYIGNDTNSIQDYSPYSKATIYLPYIGFRDLKIEEIRGANVNVTYNVDLMTGSFICYVKSTRGRRTLWNGMAEHDAPFDDPILTAEGNCFEMLPLSSTDFRNFYSGLMGAVGGAMSAMAGNPGGFGAMASSVMSMKTNVNRSGNPTSSYGFMGVQYPYIILTRPFQSIPYGFGNFEGYPSNVLDTIESFNRSYIEIDPDTIWMDDIPCFDDEMNEIKDLLNKGVYVNV